MIYSPSSHPRCICFSSFRQMQSELYFKNVLAPPRFIMAVNSRWDFEVQKSVSIHHKSAPHGSGENMIVLRETSFVFNKEKPVYFCLYQNPQTFFFSNPNFLLLIRDGCFVLLSPLRFRIRHHVRQCLMSSVGRHSLVNVRKTASGR